MTLATFEAKKRMIMMDSLFIPDSFTVVIARLKNREASITLRTQFVPATDHTSTFVEVGRFVG